MSTYEWIRPASSGSFEKSITRAEKGLVASELDGGPDGFVAKKTWEIDYQENSGGPRAECHFGCHSKKKIGNRTKTAAKIGKNPQTLN